MTRSKIQFFLPGPTYVLPDVREAMLAAGFEPEQAEVTMRAENTTPLDRDDAEKMIRLIDVLEELDDVQEVYSNADISAEILAEL